MKTPFNSFLVSLPLIAALLAQSSVCLASPIPVSVTKFTDKSSSSSCRYGWDNYWYRWLGDGFKEMLTNELNKTSKVSILERETINQIFDEEHNLQNSEDDKSLKKKKFKKAKYTLVGAVTEFEYCATSSGTSINLGSVARVFGMGDAPNLNVGKKGAKTKLGLDIRIIDTETGEIVKTVHSVSEGEDSKFEIESDYFDHDNAQNSPMGETSRKAIANAAQEILAAIN